MMIYKNLLKITVLSVLLTVSVFAREVGTYLIFDAKSIDDTKSGLTEAGFEILGEYEPINDKNHLIVVTNEELKKVASSEKRGFAGTLKVVVKGKGVKTTNPEYFLRAMLQKEFDEDISKSITASLEKALGKIKKEDSNNAVSDSNLAGYHYMIGMPYYEDMLEVGKGKNEELVAKLEKSAGEDLIFKLDLGSSVLMGVKLTGSKGEDNFVPKIDPKAKNSPFLPYTVLIEGGVAKILHPKYYIALSYPRLAMSQFMTIAFVPGEIEESFKNLLK